MQEPKNAKGTPSFGAGSCVMLLIRRKRSVGIATVKANFESAFPISGVTSLREAKR